MIRIPNIAQAAVNLAGVRLRRAERRWRGAAQHLQRFGRRVRRQQEILAHAPAAARAEMRRGTAALVRTRNRLERFDDHVLEPWRVELQVKRELARAASSGRPVVAGPWTSEVGYEALYWLPFLRWAAARYGVPPHRVIALSRGGTQSWYQGIADRYVEIFDLVESREFARQAASRRERGDQKQTNISEFDRRLVELACARLGITDPVVWQPGLMYQLFRPFWHGDRSLEFMFRHADFRPPAASVEAPPPGLPAEYAAVKFYSGPALPDTLANRETLYRLVERLAARMPVVMLDTAWSVDEHSDYSFDGIRGVTTLRPALDPRSNLDIQTRVIAGARLFLGTCGGLAWLAPVMGVETLAVYEDDRYLTPHTYAARYAYRRTGAARFSLLSVAALRSVSV